MEQKKGYALILLTGAIWGSIGLFATLLNILEVQSITVAFFRLFFASIALALLMLIMGRGLSLFKLSKKGLRSLIVIGFVSQAGFNYCYMQSIEKVGMSTASVLLYTSPIFVAIASRILFKEALTATKIAAIALNVCGCVLTVTGGRISDMVVSLSGVLFGIGAGFTYGMLPVISRFGADEENPYTAAFYGQTFGAVIVFILLRPINAGMIAAMDPRVLPVAILFGIIPSALGFSIYYMGLSRIKETSIVPILASVETVVASIIGRIVFGQSLGLVKLTGVLLVVCSIVLMNLESIRKGSE